MSDQSNLRVITLKPLNVPEVQEIPNTLEALQKAVGGYIQAIRTWADERQHLILVDEEGKLKGLQPNLVWRDDILVGTAIFTKSNISGDFVSLDDGDVEAVCDWVERSRLALGDCQ